eukprot:764966-Hanusia_phi.AAC.2
MASSSPLSSGLRVRPSAWLLLRAHRLPLAVKEPVGGGSQAVTPQYTLFSAFGHLGSGLTGGLSGLAAGMAIGIVGDAGVRATAQQPKLFVGMILILIFAEALGMSGTAMPPAASDALAGLYGLIVALIMSSSGGGACPSA